jgi:pimeloyl-ACP methyl ester carboxylesterase
MTALSRKKSTIVRTQKTVLRLLFTGAEHTLPGSAARVAERLWFRVPRTRHAGTLPAGEDFTVRLRGIAVRGRHWGSGPTVYLVHGWAGQSTQLAALVAPLLEARFRVVAFDAPGHGRSDPGAGGPGTGHAVEFGQALDEVAARFGPAHAMVAHSMGAMATLLALKHGWLGSDRLVFLAPMDALDRYLDQFAQLLHIGPRVRGRLDRRILARVGYPVAEFDLARLATEIPRPPLLIVHDRGDREVPFDHSRQLLQVWPEATLRAMEGLGHRRILSDPAVVASIVRFIRGDDGGQDATLGTDGVSVVPDRSSVVADRPAVVADGSSVVADRPSMAADVSGQASIAAASSW